MKTQIVNTVAAAPELTLEQLYDDLHFPSRSVFFEALFEVVDRGDVAHYTDRVRTNGGEVVTVRLYRRSRHAAPADGSLK